MNHRKRGIAFWLLAILLLLAGALLTGSPGRTESVQEAMRDAVLHDTGRISLFGLKEVNPGLISAFLVTGGLLLAAALIRIFAIPRFQYIPGKLQLVLEEVVGLFDGMAKSSSPHRFGFVGAYIFAAGAYIFVGTLFELLGLQADGGAVLHSRPEDVSGGDGGDAQLLADNLSLGPLPGAGCAQEDDFHSLPLLSHSRKPL